MGRDVLEVVSGVWNNPLLTGILVLIFTPAFYPLVVYFAPLLMSTALCVAAFASAGPHMEKIRAKRDGQSEREKGLDEWVTGVTAERDGQFDFQGVVHGSWYDRTQSEKNLHERAEERIDRNARERCVHAPENVSDRWSEWIKEYEASPCWGSQPILVKEEELGATVVEKKTLNGSFKSQNGLLVERQERAIGDEIGTNINRSDLPPLHSCERLLVMETGAGKTELVAVKRDVLCAKTVIVPVEVVHQLKTAGSVLSSGRAKAETAIEDNISDVRREAANVGVRNGKVDVPSGTLAEERMAELPRGILNNLKVAGLGDRRVEEDNASSIVGRCYEDVNNGSRGVSVNKMSVNADVTDEKRVEDVAVNDVHGYQANRLTGTNKISITFENSLEDLKDISVVLHTIPADSMETKAVNISLQYEPFTAEGNKRNPQKPCHKLPEVNTSESELGRYPTTPANTTWGRSYIAHGRFSKQSRRRLEPRRMVPEDNEYLSLPKSLSPKAQDISALCEEFLFTRSPEQGKMIRTSTVKPLVWKSRSVESREDERFAEDA